MEKEKKPSNFSVEFGFWLGAILFCVAFGIILVGVGCYFYNGGFRITKNNVALAMSVCAIILNVILIIKRHFWK